ncbi:MAG: response regulator transcription factor [Thermomicrobiales bacterium]
MTLKLLITEDARGVADVVAFGARMIWPDCQITIAASGVEALDRFAADPADLVILDVTIPPPDGFAVCQRIREMSQVPILMLSVRGDTIDKVRALDLGADDYLTKPFDHLELFARLRALVRRANESPAAAKETFAAGDLSIDFPTHEVRVRGEIVRLTSTEYRLLEVLARHAGTILPHQFLLAQVWGDEYIRDVHYVKVFVRRLRQKLGEIADCSSYIQTEWGIGYRFVSPAKRV